MRTLLLASALLASAFAVAQNEPPKIAGWKTQENNGTYIYTPAAAPNNFLYELMPVAESNGELATWLQQTAEKNLQVSGYTMPDAKNVQNGKVQSFNMYSAIVSDKNGQKWNLNYVAYKIPDGGVRYAKMAAPSGPKSPYMNTAIQHFLSLSKSDGIVLKKENNDGGSTASSNSGSSGSSSKTKSKRKETPVTAPGQGLKPSDIKAVVMNQEYGMGVGGMMIVEYNPYILLANGTAYKHPTVAPYDLDVAQSKIEEPTKWGTWKMNGKTLNVSFPSKGVMKPESWTRWYYTQMPKANEKMKGAYKTIGGGGNTALGGTSMIVVSNDVTFNEKGQFVMEKFAGGSNADFDVSSTTYSKSNSAGTYTLNGYSIEMRYNNGEVVRKLFYFYPDDREHFGIGGSTYIPAKK